MSDKLTTEPPPRLVEAAYELAAWTTKQGWKHWEIGPVADRSALAAEREKVKQAHIIALKLKQHYPSAKGVDELIKLTQ